MIQANEILLYFHCRKCLEENLPPKIGCGWTKKGIQVWCENHDINIVALDFKGQKVEVAAAQRPKREDDLFFIGE